MNHLRAQWREAINKREYKPDLLWRGMVVTLRGKDYDDFKAAYLSGSTRVMRDTVLTGIVDEFEGYTGAGEWWSPNRSDGEMFGGAFGDLPNQRLFHIGVLLAAHPPMTHPQGRTNLPAGTPIVIERMFLSLRPPETPWSTKWVEMPMPLMETTT